MSGPAARAAGSAAARRPARPGAPRGRTELTVLGAVLLTSVLTLAGALTDLVLAPRRLGWAFAGCFVIACVWCALRLPRRDLVAAVIIPPLVFAAGVAVVQAVVPPTGEDRPGVVDLVIALAEHGPVVIAGTLLAGMVALSRRRRQRR